MTRRFWIVVGSLAAGLVVFMWLGWQFVLHPVALKIDDQTALLASRQSDLDKVKGAQAQYEKFKRDAESTQHEVQILRQRIDPELSDGELVRIISGQVQSLNPRELTWDYSPRVVSKLEGQTGLDEVPFKMHFKSDYETVGRLLNGMASQLRFISPERVFLTSFNDQAESRVTVDAVVEFKLYLESRPMKVGN
jgi:hypothetical protein